MDITDVDFVCSDNESGAALATAQLVASGCRQLAWLNYAGSTWGGLHRAEAFKRILEQEKYREIAPLVEITAAKDGYQGGRQAAHELCASGSKVDGVFCANAQLACGFLDGMREQGLDAPNDFHLVGFDDTELTSQYSYQLSTVRQDIEEMTKRAIACLEAGGRRGNNQQRVELVPVELVLRKTSPSLKS